MKLLLKPLLSIAPATMSSQVIEEREIYWSGGEPTVEWDASTKIIATAAVNDASFVYAGLY